MPDTTTGAVVQRMDFDEWGIVVADTNPGWTPSGFAGGLSDGETGLVRFGARDLDARAGRWTAKDPIGFAGGETSLLGYGGHDPVNRADPLGLYVCNNSSNWYFAKPEKAGLEPILVPPGSYFADDVDGVRPWGEDRWYKVLSGTNVTIGPKGEIQRSGAWTSAVPDAFSRFHDRAPGWKDEPDWSGRYDDWTIPYGPIQQPTRPIDPNDPACPCE